MLRSWFQSPLSPASILNCVDTWSQSPPCSNNNTFYRLFFSQNFFQIQVFFLVFIFRITRLFAINIKVSTTPGILIISYKGYTGTIYEQQLPGLFIISFLYRSLKTNNRLGKRYNKIIGLLKNNNKNFIYRTKTLEKTKNKLNRYKYYTWV